MANFDIIEPLKALDVVAPLIRDVRNKLLALQQKEYDNATLTRLADRQLTGKPFPIEFSNDPDQIIYIKNLSNALYLAEQVFEQLAKLNLSSRTSIMGIYAIRDQADEASELLMKIGDQFAWTFKLEINQVFTYLSKFKSLTACGLFNAQTDPTSMTREKISNLLKSHVGCIQYNDDIYYFNNKTLKKISSKDTPSLTLQTIMTGLNKGGFRIASASEVEAITEATGQTPFMSNFFDPTSMSIHEISENAGLMAGRMIDQMNPAAGKPDNDLLGWFSGVLPTYIATATESIKTSAASASISIPNVNNDKVADVANKKLHKLSHSIGSILSIIGKINDPMSLITNLPKLFTLPAHFQQIQPLWAEFSQEVGHLDETIQGLIHEHLATLKYEILPNLFALVDKLEIQLLLKPGRLSIPLMEQIKPLHETLIQTAKNYLNVKFTEKAEHLLKLEDSRFIELRLAPIHQQVDESEKVLHNIERTLAALKTHLNNLNNQSDNIINSQKNLSAYFALLKPYLMHLDEQCKQILNNEHPSANPTWYNSAMTWITSWGLKPGQNPIIPALNKVKLHLEQMQTDQTFKLERNKALLASVHQNANMVLFTHNNPLESSEKEAFSHRDSLSDGIRFNNQGAVINPQDLTDDEAWDLHRWYDKQLASMDCIENDCDQLLDTLRKNQTNQNTIAFETDYVPCLLDDNAVQHQPNRVYVNIQGGALKYEVLEPLNITPYSLLKMTDVDPRDLPTIELSSRMGNHDGFILYRDQVFYFDTIALNLMSQKKVSFLTEKMRELNHDTLQISDQDDAEVKEIRAACKLYLMSLDEAKEAGHRNCYVWNNEIKQLSYIDVNGGVQNKIALSAENRSMLIMFIKKYRSMQKIERLRLATKNDVVFQVNAPDNTPDSRPIFLNSLNDVARDGTTPCYVWFRDPHQECGLMRISTDPTTMTPDALRMQFNNKPSYILFNSKLYFIDKDVEKAELIHKNVAQLDAIFPNNNNVLQDASEDNVQAITLLTGHTQYQLIYIDEQGHHERIVLNNYKKEIKDYFHNGYELDLMLITVDQVCNRENLEKFGVNPRKPTLIKQGDNYWIYGRLENNDWTVTPFINPDPELIQSLNRLNFSSNQPYDAPDSSALNQYITSIQGHTKTTLPHLVKLVDRNRRADQLIKPIPQTDNNRHLNLTIDNIDRFIKPDGGHHPGLIRTGTIPLSELGCELAQVTSIIPLKPYLPRVMDKALERGHIHNNNASQCIRCYSAIQPYLINAYKNDPQKKIQAFDNDVVNFLSGLVYKSASEPRTDLSFTDFKSILPGFKTFLSTKKATLRMQRTALERKRNGVKETAFVVEPSPVAAIYHQTFLPDVAEFMLSIDPIKRQAHESSKTLFRVKLALEHLNKYCEERGYNEVAFDNRAQNLKNEHYAWFHTYHAQLSEQPGTTYPVTATQLKTHLKQIQYYEDTELKRNNAIIASINPQSPLVAEQSLSETTAFMQLIHHHEFKPCLMKDSNDLELAQLYLSISDQQLHYKFLHYGQPLIGDIALSDIEPLSYFDEKTTLSKQTIDQILSIAFEQRAGDIIQDTALMSIDEALDLYQWYQSKQNDMKTLSTEDRSILRKKLNLYKKHASKQPKIEPEKNRILVEQEDRTAYLLKHTRFAAALTDIQESIQHHVDYLRDSFKNELERPLTTGIPFPDVGTHSPITSTLLNVVPPLLTWIGEENPINLAWWGSGLLQMNQAWLNNYIAKLKPAVKTQSPHQVLLYKRLMNITYSLEKMMAEIEKINKGETKLLRLNHLVISYLDLADIYPLLVDLSSDPHFSSFFQDIVSKMMSIIKIITDENEQYSTEDQTKPNTKSVKYLYFMNLFKMFPEHISSSSEVYQANKLDLQVNSSQTMANIEKILSDYHASYSYLRLFLDLPMIFGLLKELQENLKDFKEKTNKRIKDDLETTSRDLLSTIMVNADAWEITIGLKPGTVSTPLKKILDEFYKGLIKPLVLDADKRVSLLCDSAPAKKRRVAVAKRKGTSINNTQMYNEASTSMQAVLDACKTSFRQLDYLKEMTQIANLMQDATMITWDQRAYDESLAQLNATYQKTLPLFKNALNGSRLYLMSFNEAKDAGYKNCFVWDQSHSNLFYLDEKGEPNAQTGIDLYLKAIPDHEDITRDTLAQERTYYDENGVKKTKQVYKSMLIKHGKKYVMCEVSDATGWTRTELDAGVINKMHLDFDKPHRLHRNKKYQAMYDEIRKKTGWTYPILLKRPYDFAELLQNKASVIVSPETTEPQPFWIRNPLANARGSETSNETITEALASEPRQRPVSNEIYLSENEIKAFITSNSQFVLQKHGVSLPGNKGCCFISMPTVPDNFDSLTLPRDYNAYYVQVKGINDRLYYIDRKARTIKTLSIRPDVVTERKARFVTHFGIEPTDEQVSFEKIISRVRKNKLMLKTDFNIIIELTGHEYQPDCISNLDELVLDTHTITQLESLATQCKQHYDGLSATAQLETKAAQEQLDFLSQQEIAQLESNQKIKQSIFEDHFNNTVDVLCKDTRSLQGYTLCPLTDPIKMKPDHIYININDKTLDYKVIDPAGLEQKGSIELSALGYVLEEKPSLVDLQAYLPQILHITSRGNRHTRSHSLAFEYQEKLKADLLAEKSRIIDEAMHSDSKTIDQELNARQLAFNEKYLEEYRKLNKLTNALDAFMLYLNDAEKQWSTRQSLFESPDTIRKKRVTLLVVDELAANNALDVTDRINQITTYLLNDSTLDYLMGFSTYESNSFAKLFQLVLQLFEAMGLYTPSVVQHVDKLLHAIEEPTENVPAQSYRFHFFTETTRKNIHTRTDALKTKLNPNPAEEDLPPTRLSH